MLNTIILICLLSVIVTFTLYKVKFKGTHYQRMALSVLVIVSSVSLWWFMAKAPQKAIQSSLPAADSVMKISVPTETHDEMMASIQVKLQQDPNQNELWFQLGQGYLVKNEFQSAYTCFDYALRLTDLPTAAEYSAKATALYYLSSQTLTDQVDELLTQALHLNKNDPTTLTLLASDYMLSFQYQKAIDTWIQLLDSQQMHVDRIKLINQINNAKTFL